LYLVSYLAALLNDLVGTHIPRGKLSFYPKAIYTLHGQYLEIHKVTYFELEWFSSSVSIAFLSSLGSFHVLLDNEDLLFGFFDKVNSVVPPFTTFNLV